VRAIPGKNHRTAHTGPVRNDASRHGPSRNPRNSQTCRNCLEQGAWSVTQGGGQCVFLSAAGEGRQARCGPVDRCQMRDGDECEMVWVEDTAHRIAAMVLSSCSACVWSASPHAHGHMTIVCMNCSSHPFSLADMRRQRWLHRGRHRRAAQSPCPCPERDSGAVAHYVASTLPTPVNFSFSVASVSLLPPCPLVLLSSYPLSGLYGCGQGRDRHG